MQLLNSSGGLITSSGAGGTTSESITTQLNTGTYYVRVYPYGSANTNYNLSLNATAVAPIDYAGNSTSTARDIGTLNSRRSFSDWVGTADTNDYYRFYVGSQSNFSLNLTGLSADADVQLLNSSGGLITSSAADGSSSESISTQLSAGNYYVRVFPYGSAETNYNLTVSATSVTSSQNEIMSYEYFVNNWQSLSWYTSPQNPFVNSYTVNGQYHDGNCTWYAYGRMLQLGYQQSTLNTMLGNAGTWDNTAGNGASISTTPQVGSIALWEAGVNGAGSVGHVAVVERINTDGTITISESNWGSPQRYSTRTIAANNPSKFIIVPRA
ncbi:CHAP domain-containing protein [Sphaerospermopsis aphanizomenoides BCCUSP55]|uniref:CHAP domain-containing protein n=1 Tax=Sphaerospermopsis aphanizomenoides TaxID=459663 RepID=UPI001904DDD1|nr:PPC domain-containing protein [Sphaerospermopsis aphanizomenoides]MBK1986088.1 CHAP domain-containing protein [Sphaerospermopsis aphanizomenoides BCCUSP55]